MLYTNATIVTVNADRQIIRNGSILVNDDLITDIGETEALSSKYRDVETYDLTGHIVIPGLVNTHMHTAQTLLRGTNLVEDLKGNHLLQGRSS